MSKSVYIDTLDIKDLNKYQSLGPQSKLLLRVCFLDQYLTYCFKQKQSYDLWTIIKSHGLTADEFRLLNSLGDYPKWNHTECLTDKECHNMHNWIFCDYNSLKTLFKIVEQLGNQLTPAPVTILNDLLREQFMLMLGECFWKSSSVDNTLTEKTVGVLLMKLHKFFATIFQVLRMEKGF